MNRHFFPHMSSLQLQWLPFPHSRPVATIKIQYRPFCCAPALLPRRWAADEPAASCWALLDI